MTSSKWLFHWKTKHFLVTIPPNLSRHLCFYTTSFWRFDRTQKNKWIYKKWIRTLIVLTAKIDVGCNKFLYVIYSDCNLYTKLEIVYFFLKIQLSFGLCVSTACLLVCIVFHNSRYGFPTPKGSKNLFIHFLWSKILKPYYSVKSSHNIRI